MRCFYHQTNEAVGLCRHCGRGLCPDCAADTTGGLACKGNHEDQVQRVAEMVARNVSTVGTPGLAQYLTTIALALIAVGFLGFGAFSIRDGETSGWLLILLGVVLSLSTLNNLRWILGRRSLAPGPQK
jgi:hypothetical protein